VEFIKTGKEPLFSGTQTKMKLLRYKLAPGTQVREEDFGLLFYQMKGPRLYFLSSGKHLREDFFSEDKTLEALPDSSNSSPQSLKNITAKIEKALSDLASKGVIVEY
jgi:putative mycofactocin binding protein MftB